MQITKIYREKNTDIRKWNVKMSLPQYIHNVISGESLYFLPKGFLSYCQEVN